MSGSVLLDTTVAIAHLRSRNEHLVQHLETGGRLYLPLAGLGELCAGIERSAQRETTLAAVTTLLKLVTILYPSDATAKEYGRIFAELTKAGTPIPHNDIWIAALAREHGLPIATRDAHFGCIKGLELLNW